MKNGALDFPSLQRLIEHNIANGVAGVSPVGTTGESPTLTHEEHAEVIRRTVEFVEGRVPVIAGAGSNCTAEAVSLSKQAEAAGAQAILSVAPYYNRPSQNGLFFHFRAIAEAVSIPVVLYSIPSRCGVEIGVSTVERLAAVCPNIRCIKEAGGSVERVNALRSVLPEDFVILSGDDSLTLPFLAAGAKGVISVASNLLPKEVVQLVKYWQEGRTAEALAMHLQLYPLFRDLFVESNPVPLKHALARRGLIASDEVRLPLSPLSPSSLEKFEATLLHYHL